MLHQPHPGYRPSAASLSNWPWLVPLALAGFIIALFGTYWDDAWHTETGRDSFFIAPHITLYAGISLTGGALFAWAALAVRAVGVRRALGSPALVLSLLGLVITFVAAPADNAWHLAFGRDAVLWSPPHMLGVAGSLAIATGLLLELASAPRSGRTSAAAALVAAAAVIAVCTIPVLEYETDVPQFDIGFYLPALATGAAFAFGLIRLALSDRYAASKAALVQAAVVFAIGAVLLVAGMPTPLVPLLAIPALTLDRFGARFSVPTRALTFTAAIYLVYVPYLNWATSGLYLTFEQMAWGFPLAFLGVAVAFLITSDRRPSIRARVGIASSALLLALPALGAAHDPGQGQELSTAQVRVSAAGHEAEIEVSLENQEFCRALEPVATTARRAGQVTTGSLSISGACSFRGQVKIPERGRWFVYAEFIYQGRAVETWMPVHSDADEVVADSDRSLYVPPTIDDPAIKKIAGIGIYAGLVATLLAIPALYRRQRPS